MQNNDSAKICPFMSGAHYIHINDDDRGTYEALVDCKRERCAAWISPCDIFEQFKTQPGDTMQDCPSYEHACQDQRPFCAGYCALIFQQRRRS